ncbi:hypothetical protein FOPG_17573 [Fusarium oxysporum f. sp. conglutinans race 2 54008]|nr:hypothetical protein FOPG_17573 [Fusarium oxysporum f. sp. conglutinans race 2 54008]
MEEEESSNSEAEELLAVRTHTGLEDKRPRKY